MAARVIALSALVGCQWIDDPRLAARTDRDGDGYPLPLDCDDGDGDVDELPQADQTLACGDEVDTEARNDVALTVGPCIDPSSGGTRMLPFGAGQDLYAVEVDVPTRVTLDLEPEDDGFGGDPAQGDDAGVTLFAFPGRRCDAETCAVGLPAFPSGGESVEVTFDAAPGAPWSVLVARGNGADEAARYRLVVRCE